MQIYSGGVIAVFTVFALMHVNAYRRRVELDLTRVSCSRHASASSTTSGSRPSALSVAIATFGGPWAAAAIAGPIY
jgi:hypothetical protein